MRGTSGKVVHFSEVALFPKLTFQLVLVYVEDHVNSPV